MAHTTAHIVDAKLRPVPSGMPGELCLGGPQIARGYHGRPELTSEKFIPDTLSEKGNHLYRTGDRARLLADGNIEFLGRLDQQVKIRGFRVELGEIECVLREHESVSDAVAIARADGENMRLIAYVVAAPHHAILSDGLRTHMQRKLPDYMVPSVVVQLREFPLTPSRKIDRLALAAAEGEVATGSDSRVPADSVERTLVEIWESVLGVKPISVCDNFFELGGNSLRAVQILVRSEAAFGNRLPVPCLIGAPTIAELARQIRCHAMSQAGLRSSNPH